MDFNLKRLYEAAYANDVHSLEELLKEDHLLLDRVITTTEVNDNPLHVAAILGHAGFAREILKRKARLAREFNAQGMSPLHLAAAEGHLEVANVLLQVDPDLCYVKEIKDGYLPVHIAVIKGRHDIVTFLIEKCKDSVKELTYMSENLLHIAVKAKHSEIVEFFTTQDVMQLMLNKKDGNGNTALHLAFSGRQRYVIKHLLSQKNIDVNVMNLAGLTPLDVLLVSNHEMGDLNLGECLRAAGGKTAKELGVSEMNIIDSSSVVAHMDSEERPLPTKNKQITKTRSKGKDRYKNIENNLIVVATLVATVTFAAALNPPGGSIQMPFNDSNRKDPVWFRNWKHMDKIYPAGSPVYLWKLKKFFMYDYFALFTSVSVILLCLPKFIPRGIIVTKFLLLVLWCSIFFMIIAFKSALSILLYKDKNSQKFPWFVTFFDVWAYFFAFMSARLFGDFIISVIRELVKQPQKGKKKENNGRPSTRQGWIMRNYIKVIKGAPSFLAMVGIFIFVGWGIGWTISEMAGNSTFS